MATQNVNDLVVPWYTPFKLVSNPHELPQGYLKHLPRDNGEDERI